MQSRYINSNVILEYRMGGGNPPGVAVFCSAAGSLPPSSNCRLASPCSHFYYFTSQAHPNPLNPSLLSHSHLGDPRSSYIAGRR